MLTLFLALACAMHLFAFVPGHAGRWGGMLALVISLALAATQHGAEQGVAIWLAAASVAGLLTACLGALYPRLRSAWLDRPGRDRAIVLPKPGSAK